MDVLDIFLLISCLKPVEGRYLERLCDQDACILGTRHNFLGLELWAPLVHAANERASQRPGPKNLYYVAGNVKLSMAALKLPNLQRVRFVTWGVEDI